MLREEFYKTVDEEGAAFLPQEFLGSKVQVGVVEKTSGNYMGASILLPDSIISPVVNLDSIYEKIRDLDMPSAMYKVGQVFEQVLTGMDRELINIVSSDKIGEMFENYDMLKENLFVACASQSARFSKNKVPMEMRGDIRLVVKLNVSNKTFGTETITITKSQMKHLGISGERLFEDAFANMKEKLGVRFQSLGEVLGMLNLPPEEKLDRVLYVLSSERGTLGASMLYAPGVMEDIYQKMQGDYPLSLFSPEKEALMSEESEVLEVSFSAGALLHELREAAGLSQEGLAKILLTSKEKIRCVEEGNGTFGSFEWNMAAKMNDEHPDKGYVHPVHVIIDPKTGRYLDQVQETSPVEAVAQIPAGSKTVILTNHDILYGNYKKQPSDKKTLEEAIRRFMEGKTASEKEREKDTGNGTGTGETSLIHEVDFLNQFAEKTLHLSPARLDLLHQAFGMGIPEETILEMCDMDEETCKYIMRQRAGGYIDN
uniref:DUF5688 family protein n=1 Tax=Eubacterium cellulosolvens TaxID=29322 RepID=UPI0004838CA1|nr:DUF5688 family protein [[Eubacterium] cellulosolvens]